MELESKNIGQVYADRAMEEKNTSSTVTPKDMVFTQTPILNSNDYGLRKPTYQINKKIKKRKFSPFSVILFLICGAIISVTYIGNILAVNRLMMQINHYQVKHSQLLNEQELLKAQINKLSNLENIQQAAQNNLGLEISKEIPVWIEIDQERVKEIEKIISRESL